MKNLYDIIIIGAGPAGLSAAIYAARAGQNVVVLEKMFAGGQITSTYEVENYPGIVDAVSGPDLAYKFEAHARKFDINIIYEETLALALEGEVKTVKTAKGEYSARGIILAMGAKPKPLGIPKEKQLVGSGVSYCATCDGMFYKDKDVAVVGGGNTAAEDALFLARMCNKVYLVHRRDVLRADDILVKKIAAEPKIELVLDSVVKEIYGEKVSAIGVENVKTGFIDEIAVSGLFVAVGTAPQTKIVENLIDLTQSGHIITNEKMQTNIDKVYAVGDVRDKILRQVVTAAADGAIAAMVFAGE
jgi:thioredoxin reductase (NADPH)